MIKRCFSSEKTKVLWESCWVAFRVGEKGYVKSFEESAGIAEGLLLSRKADAVFTRIVLSRAIATEERKTAGLNQYAIGHQHSTMSYDGGVTPAQFLQLVNYDRNISNKAWQEHVRDTASTFNA